MATGTADRQQAQRARLLEGLAASIREKGLARTQVGDIVRHAHASRRTFYKHFADKEACFVDLLETMSRALLIEVDAAIDRETPVANQVDQAIDTYLERVTGNLALARTFASPGLGERVVVAQREAFERHAELIVSVLESDSERDPGIEPISVQRAYMLVAGLHQTVARALVRGEDLHETAAEIRTAMKLALGAAPSSVR